MRRKVIFKSSNLSTIQEIYYDIIDGLKIIRDNHSEKYDIETFIIRIVIMLDKLLNRILEFNRYVEYYKEKGIYDLDKIINIIHILEEFALERDAVIRDLQKDIKNKIITDEAIKEFYTNERDVYNKIVDILTANKYLIDRLNNTHQTS